MHDTKNYYPHPNGQLSEDQLQYAPTPKLGYRLKLWTNTVDTVGAGNSDNLFVHGGPYTYSELGLRSQFFWGIEY